MSYADALSVDLVSVAFGGMLLACFGRLSHSHPGTMYLIFHLYTFTTRLLGLANGAPTLFSEAFWGPGMDPVREEEIVRVALIADVTLLVMSLGWILAARRERTDERRGIARAYWIPLDLRLVKSMAFVTLPVGLAGLVLFGQLPGIDNSYVYADLGEWGRSSYVVIIQAWAGLALLALIYCYGAKWWLLVPFAAYLGIMGYQGVNRYRVLIPLLLFIQIQIDRRGRRWPSMMATATLLTAGLIFFPLKSIGRLAQEGATRSEIIDRSGDVLRATIIGEGQDHLLLDEIAAALTLVDEGGILYYGQPFAALITLAVPRQLWAEKPTPADYIGDLSRPWRPMRQSGMVIGLIGEAYANFGYAGLALEPLLLSYLLGRMYFRSYRVPYLSIGRFFYLLMACNLIQVYRDGLVSLFMFTIVNMLPLSIMAAAHIATSPRSPRMVGTTV